MLVLSRRLNESVLLPDLQVAIQVVAIKPGVIRLGITAPPAVHVLRGELPNRRAEWGPPEAAPAQPAPKAETPELERMVRTRLRINRTGLAELRERLRAGQLQEAKQLVDKIEEDIALLQRRLNDNQPPATPSVPERRRTVLLVEDDRNSSELLAGYLRMANLEVITAADGLAALEYLQSHPCPDVVLLDMVLPRCDGPTLLRAVRANPAWAGLKVFGLTGHALDQFDLGVGPQGVDRWFRKPVNPDRLLEAMNQELGQRSSSVQPATA